jgi:transcriptional regulator GlxA family with amidase domain
MKSARCIGIVAYDRVQALDVVGPWDAFAAANAENGTSVYELLTLGLRKGLVTSEGRLGLVVDCALKVAPPLDTVIIPGGAGLRVNASLRQDVATWLRDRAPSIRRVASVCTGIYALAEAGLLDGLPATTHWQYAAELRARWPKVDVNPNAIYIKAGQYYTSAGITAGIDLALAMIEEDLGSALAIKVARELVVYAKRPGGQLQFSEPLRMQQLAGTKLSDTVSWMLQNLAGDLSVDALARRASLSPRHFARKFKELFQSTPAELVEQLRLDHARWLLLNDVTSIEGLAAAVGYASDDSFRRAFARRFGRSPTNYRRLATEESSAGARKRPTLADAEVSSPL